MACRCGKTPVAYTVARLLTNNAPPCAPPCASPCAPPCVLFLVPGLYLLRQTAQKLANYARADAHLIRLLLVGSDARPVETAAGPLAMTTEPAAIAAYLAGAADRPRWVVSTYQSSHLLVPELPRFQLVVFDEAHRACGGRAPRPFNDVLRAIAPLPLSPSLSPQLPLSPQLSQLRCLFMTATPAYDPVTPDTFSMRDRALFGGVASRYYLRQGIAAGFVNDFRLELVAVDAKDAGGLCAGICAAMARPAPPSVRITIGTVVLPPNM